MIADPLNVFSDEVQMHGGGDCATNLSEQAIYLITGAFPSDERPKQDVVSVNLSELRDG